MAKAPSSKARESKGWEACFQIGFLHRDDVARRGAMGDDLGPLRSHISQSGRNRARIGVARQRRSAGLIRPIAAIALAGRPSLLAAGSPPAGSGVSARADPTRGRGMGPVGFAVYFPGSVGAGGSRLSTETDGVPSSSALKIEAAAGFAVDNAASDHRPETPSWLSRLSASAWLPFVRLRRRASQWVLPPPKLPVPHLGHFPRPSGWYFPCWEEPRCARSIIFSVIERYAAVSAARRRTEWAIHSCCVFRVSKGLLLVRRRSTNCCVSSTASWRRRSQSGNVVAMPLNRSACAFSRGPASGLNRLLKKAVSGLSTGCLVDRSTADAGADQ